MFLLNQIFDAENQVFSYLTSKALKNLHNAL